MDYFFAPDTYWDQSVDGWVQRSCVRELAHTSTIIGPFAAIIGPSGACEIQRHGRRARPQIIDESSHENYGLSKKDTTSSMDKESQEDEWHNSVKRCG